MNAILERTIRHATTPLGENEIRPHDMLAGQAAAFARDIERLLSRRGEFVKVACPVCEIDESSFSIAKDGFEYVRCDHCATLFMSPRPSPEIMKSYYAASENYRYWAEHIYPASECARREKIHRPRLERIVSLCHQLGFGGGQLMEVGAGFGTFCELAKASGRFEKVIAIEPTPEMACACRLRGIETIEAPIESCSSSDLTADVVVSFEVIEHVFNPRVFVAQCYRLLRPGGLLVLTSPNGLGFDVMLLGPASSTVDAEHVNLMNPRSLGILLERAGFETVETTTPGRLDAELVRRAMLEGRFMPSEDAFLRRALMDEWDDLGPPLQDVIAGCGWSSHMWIAARKIR